MSKFTPEQQAAIDTEGRVIVSASAGSGKTTVMIQKMINLICDKGIDVTRILAVTYTKKAAASMKDKLRKALVKAINNPATSLKDKERLKAQYRLVPLADISTIHSFCAKLIRTHFYATDVGNKFGIMAEDDANGLEIRARAIENLFEQAYEGKEEDFLKLLSVYYRKKNDNLLREVILSTHSTVRTHVDYKKELESSGEDTDERFNAVCDELFAWYANKCKIYREELSLLYGFFEKEAGRKDFADYCGVLMDVLNSWLDAGDIFTLASLRWKSLPDFPKTDENDPPEVLAAAKKLGALRVKIKKQNDEERGLKTLASRDEERRRFSLAMGLAKPLGKYVIRFDEEYTRLKRLRGVLDYNDLEHIALQLLRVDEIAAEMREKYQYVFVDEYQDVNPVQESIINAVSGENLFLVGDIKQSIYAFRGSKSKFFADKFKAFKASPTAHALPLSKNFRSVSPVLDAVNEQFVKLMTPKNTEVDYEADGKMLFGELYKAGEGRVQVHFAGKPQAEKSAPPSEVYSVRKNTAGRSSEISLTAKKIREIIERELKGEYYNVEKGKYMPIRYADIAVLDRWKKGEIGEVVRALAAEGVPVSTESPLNICEFPEVKVLIDLLRLIDNARQDVPLASVLLSPIGGFTEDDLAEIRLATHDLGKVSFRTACKTYAARETDKRAERLKAFFEYLDEIRLFAQVENAGEVLTRVIAEKQMEAALLGGINGENCLKRIHRFIEETRNPEPLDTHAFLARLKMLDNAIYYYENGGENAVHVMTMHASKGLEFPVVIVSGLGRKFRLDDEKNESFYVDGYGLALKAYDPKTMVYTSTLLRLLYKRRELLETVRDELNLYYVALTRAQYSLHMIFNEERAFADIYYGKSFEEVTDFSVWEKYKMDGAGIEIPVLERQPLVVDADETLVEQIVRAQEWQYGHSGCEDMPAKTSPTALMKLAEAKTPEERAHAYVEVAEGLSGEEPAESETDTVKGSAYHAFLEHFDFSLLESVCGNRDGLLALVEEGLTAMREGELLSEEYLAVLDKEKLADVLSNSVFYRLRDVHLYKEQQFLTALPAGEVLSMLGEEGSGCPSCDEDMLFQGAIDLLAVGDGYAEIIDYKYSRKGQEALRKTYSMQLRLYRMAVARALKIPMENISCTIVNIFYGFEMEIE
ncbi:MAG: hypothetical protein E7367_03630 [Clostridiales bacterium]|nr:hypothetical protein [Clostridiales bacterium]